MIPLDPIFYYDATVGGVVAANTSGPRRRLYGSVRDAVIGMKFATLEGNIVSSGGMVVKNVAGLDMGKVMIGSLGTLAAIASVNFKVSPIPPVSRTFVFEFPIFSAAIQMRNRILTSALQPAAIDVIRRDSRANYFLAVQAGGSEEVMARYGRELSGGEVLDGETERAYWDWVREFVPAFLARSPEGCVVRMSSPLHLLPSVTVPFVYRAGNGIIHACYADSAAAERWMVTADHAIVETNPYKRDQWPVPGGDFEVMKKIKQMFDPLNLLNPGRLYGRL
jgi:glycolate oxidase FAD binding subunit